MAHLTLTFLGSAQVVLGQKAVSHFRSAKVQGLLTYLAMEAQRAHTREALLALFWPEESQEVAQRNLRQSLFRLRQILGDEQPTGVAPYLRVDRQTVQFNPASDYGLDVAEFSAHLAAGRLAQAVELYQGELLTGFSCESAAFDEWLFFTRESLHLQALEALATLSQRALAQGQSSAALQYARRQLALEPWREAAHQQVMLAFAMAGERGKALAHYESCCATLWQELQVEPTAETLALAEQIRTGEIDKETGRQEDKKRGRQGDTRPELGQRAAASSERFPSPPLPVFLSSPLIDWGEAPAAATFYGRQNELDHLSDWVVNARCRVVTVVGMGGMGKTVLVAHLTRRLANQFDRVIWRSLLNAPPLSDLLRTLLQFLSNQGLTAWPASQDEQMALLFAALHQQRCLLVLDNWESLLLAGDRSGFYRPGYEAYGQLLLRMGETAHQSCLLLTSRERPHTVTVLEPDAGAVRLFALQGLDAHIGCELLGAHGVTGLGRSAAALVARYSGNPLALKLVAETIVDFFDGAIDLFLREETFIFDDIRTVLDQQFARLTPLERAIILWLAIEREACTLQTLHGNLWPPPAKRDLLEALRSLQQRSLLEKNGNGMTLQNVVLEYAIDTLLDQVQREINLTAPVLLKSHALFQAQAKTYIRQSQQRLILQPLGTRLVAELGATVLTVKFKAILTALRTAPSSEHDYAGGNLLNLLLHWGAAAGLPLAEYDFSQLTLRQVYLQGVRLPAINFAQTRWVAPVFTNTFGNVTTVAFSRDGQLLAAGSSDGAIRFWRIADGQLVMTLVGHERFVWTLAFSPDGKLLASGSADQTVRLWDIEQGQLRHTFHGHGDAIYAVAFHPTGELLASCGVGDAIRLWNIRQGKPHALLAHPYSQLDGMAFDPTGRYLAAAGKDRHLFLWEVASGQLTRSFTGHEGGLRHLCFSPDGQWLAASCYDQTVRIWQVARAEAAITLRAHAAEVGAVAYSPDGRWLASGSWDKTVRIWNLQSGQTIQTLYGHNDWITALAFSPDGSLLASSSWDKSIRLWDVGNFQSGILGAARQSLIGFVSSIYILAFSGNGALLASGGEDHLVRLWDMAKRAVVRTLEGHSAPIYGLAFQPQGTLLASGGNDWTIRLWDSQTGQPVGLLEGHTNSVKSLAFAPHPAANLLASASKDQTIRLWDVAHGRTLHQLKGHNATVAAVAFHPSGALLASGSYDQTVRLWDVPSGVQLLCLHGHTSWVYTVAFSPDGKLLASASYDKTICLWDVQRGELCQTLLGHTDYVYAVAFSPDGGTLASSSTDQTVRVWDVATGALRHTLTGHTNWVWTLAFSPTGDLLASGSVDETINLWDPSSGVCQQTLRPPGPYTGMNITGATGLTAAQKAALRTLGAVEIT